MTLKTTQKECSDIRAKADKAGVKIASLASGIYWSYNLGCDKVTDRNRAEQAAKKMLQIAQWLGTDALLFIPGAVDVFFNPAAEVIPYDILFARVKEGTQRLLRTAEQCKVALCVENVWNKFLLSPIEMRDFIDGFDSEFVACVLRRRQRRWRSDTRSTGSASSASGSSGCISRITKLAAGTADGFCDLLEGDVNWPEVVRALKAVGYDGYCTAEMIPLYKISPMMRIQNTSNAMDAILAM